MLNTSRSKMLLCFGDFFNGSIVFSSSPGIEWSELDIVNQRIQVNALNNPSTQQSEHSTIQALNNPSTSNISFLNQIYTIC